MVVILKVHYGKEVSTIGIYRTAELMINEMVRDLISNQKIMKYIVYDDSTVDPATKSDIANPSQYIYNPRNPTQNNYRIFQIPKIPTTQEEKKTIVSAHLLRTEKINNNPYYKDYIIAFDIFCHIDIYSISGGIIRPLRIMDEIHELYNFKYSTNSIKNLIALNDVEIAYNNTFYGYRIIYKAQDFSTDNK